MCVSSIVYGGSLGLALGVAIGLALALRRCAFRLWKAQQDRDMERRHNAILTRRLENAQRFAPPHVVRSAS